MHRHCITSAGPLVIDVERLAPLAGVAVTVACFHADGWERPPKVWTSRKGHNRRDETLAEFLAWLVPLPKREAASLAKKVLGQWLDEAEARADQGERRRTERQVRLLLAGATAVCLLALVGASSLVLLVAS